METGTCIRCVMNRTGTAQGVGSQLAEIAIDTLIYPWWVFSVVNVACVISVLVLVYVLIHSFILCCRLRGKAHLEGSIFSGRIILGGG